MNRTKDFIFVDVLNQKGRKLGFIKDILLDFSEGYVKGFSISSYNMFSKNLTMLIEDILVLNDNILVKKLEKQCSYVKFSSIKHMDIVNKKGDMIGVLEDLIIDIKDFSIKGLIICPGVISKLLRGKEVILIKNCILGEKDILFCEDNKVLSFRSIPRKLIGVDKHEEYKEYKD